MTPSYAKLQSSSVLYGRLLGYVMPYRWAFAGAIFAMAIGGIVEGSFAWLLKNMLDKLFIDGNQGFAWIASLGVIVVFLTTGLSHFIAGYGMQWVGNRVMLDIRNQMFDQLVRLPAQTFDSLTSGELMSRLTSDVMGVQAASTTAITAFVRSSFTLFGLLLTMLVLNWKLAIITLVTAPLLAAVIGAFGKRLRALSISGMEAQGAMLEVIREAIAAQRVIKISGSEDYEAARFGDSANRLRQLIMKQSIASAASTPVTHLLVSIAISAIVYLAASRTLGQSMPVADFIAFVVAAAALVPQIKQLASVNEQVQRGLASAIRVFELIDTKPESDTGTNELNGALDSISIRGVSLKYPSKDIPALEDISLEIMAGETLALVGPSGGGKTSLINLLPRFFEPTTGQIYLNDIPITSIKLANLRSKIALVSQEIVLFNDSIAANIAYGRRGNSAKPVSHDDIIRAARQANCMDFIGALPEGFDTLVGENGTRLSGGQRQRLAIARALLKDAPVLLLDEATSALDGESERAVQVALDLLMKGRTTIVVAHRLSTIEGANRIAVIDCGKIVALGTHKDLLTTNALYANLYRNQFASA
jgi:ATP-binding cassette, subfamily B, bacterial MsbA